MNATDVVGYAIDGAIICPDCATEEEIKECHPMFASEEVEGCYPVCDRCAEEITDCTLINPDCPDGYEVFYHDESDSEEGTCWRTEDTNEPLESGWYWWSCQPGCLPDGEPSGPFDTEEEAIRDILDGI